MNLEICKKCCKNKNIRYHISSEEEGLLDENGLMITEYNIHNWYATIGTEKEIYCSCYLKKKYKFKDIDPINWKREDGDLCNYLVEQILDHLNKEQKNENTN